LITPLTRERRGSKVRLKGEEAVEQGLFDIRPLILVPACADPDVVEGESGAARLLDLMPQQKRAWRLLLHRPLGHRRKANAQPIVQN
jgi:hypothetical protein